PPHLAQPASRHRALRLRENEVAQERARLAHRKRRYLVDAEPAHPHPQRVLAQSGAAAGRTPLVAAVAGEEDPDLHLVLLPFQPAEEAQDAREVVVALQHEAPLRLLEGRPPLVPGDPAPPRETPEVVLEAPVMGLVPGLDRPLGEALALVRDHEVQVDLDQVAEAVAGRAGAR